MGCGISRGDVRPTLYIWPGSAPCRAVMMTASAAKVRLRMRCIDILKGEQHSSKFKKINPKHTVPALVDGKSKVLESQEIMLHLIDVYAPGSRLYPNPEDKRTAIDIWLQYDKHTLHEAVTAYVYPRVFTGVPAGMDAEMVVRECLHKVNMELENETFLTGSHVTLADFAVMADLSLLELIDYKFGPWPLVVKWRNRMKGLSYYASCNKGLEDWKFALLIGGPKEGVKPEVKVTKDGKNAAYENKSNTK